ncbi:MAG: phospholipase [Clostridia bacterium]|nr:phospholipase [Clostridia bacterium]
MRFGSLRTELIYDSIKNELVALNSGNLMSAFFPKSINLIMRELPQVNEQQAFMIIELVCKALLETQNEKISLVATVPPSFSLKTKRIQNTAEDLLKNASQSILLTGYSISDFIADLIDVLIEKSQKGILVKIYLNDVKNQTAIEKLLRYRGRFLQIYDYTNKEDKMAALHAKIIMVDNYKTLISSANLSYHGMFGNIEIGTSLVSAKIAKQIDTLFKDLLFSGVFSLLGE